LSHLLSVTQAVARPQKIHLPSMKSAKPKSPRRSSATSADTISTRQTPPPEGGTPNAPHSQIILLAVTGMSPAVLTETVWALAHPLDGKTTPAIPDRVIVLTTRRGATAMEEELLTPDQSGKSIWDALGDHLAQEGFDVANRLRFGSTRDHIQVIARYDGRKPVELEDVATEQDNEAAGDAILNALWGEVEKPGVQIIASIAGGFKTMSALLLSCVSLIGRKDDRITHVLVNSPYDNRELKPKFYYPAQSATSLCVPDGKRYSPGDAKILLMDVPFVALRKLFAKYLVAKPRSYRELVAECRETVVVLPALTPRLSFCTERFELFVNDQIVRLPPTHYMVLLFFAIARQEQKRFEKYRDAFAAYTDFLQTMLAGDKIHSREFTLQQHLKRCQEDLKKAGADSADADYRKLNKILSDIRVKLAQAKGHAMALLEALPAAGRPCLNLPPKNIRVQS